MTPIPIRPTPRLIIYHQTHHTATDKPISLLPLLTQSQTRPTHIILAAIHLNSPTLSSAFEPLPPLHLNNHPPSHPRFNPLWSEVALLRAAGIFVLSMLGGAARGTFSLLDGSDAAFETHYLPLRDFLRTHRLDGIDLDIEEPVSLGSVVRLIDRLRADFGAGFLITLAPVAMALVVDRRIENYAEFSYEALEVMRGREIAWYNTQFYCGWGDMSSTAHYEMIIARGFPVEKIVVGVVTNPGNGAGWVPPEVLGQVLGSLRSRLKGFGGVMGWEYFNGLPGGGERPWEWVGWMGGVLGMGKGGVQEVGRIWAERGADVVDEGSEESDVPRGFEYLEEGIS
ncbi:hypothetical protein MMC26_004445 [Xylographa opegraphella]|nr:hypothetical protein [Xylographa opegraphella]